MTHHNPIRHAKVLRNKGDALVELGNYEEAISFYDQALEIDPDDNDALNNKGLA